MLLKDVGEDQGLGAPVEADVLQVVLGADALADRVRERLAARAAGQQQRPVHVKKPGPFASCNRQRRHDGGAGHLRAGMPDSGEAAGLK